MNLHPSTQPDPYDGYPTGPGTPHPGGPTGPRHRTGHPWQLWLLALSPGLAAALGLAGGWLLTVVAP